jgi:hypothetical protein
MNQVDQEEEPNEMHLHVMMRLYSRSKVAQRILTRAQEILDLRVAVTDFSHDISATVGLGLGQMLM